MPCTEIFDKQQPSYKKKVLSTKNIVVIEAASSFGWHKYVNENGFVFCIDSFGESGNAEDLYNHFGLNSDIIYKKIIELYYR